MSEHVVFKLVTGETIIANLLNETEHGVHVINPILIKVVPLMGENGEYTESAISTKYCQYTEEVDFTFNIKDIVYCKPLSPKMVSTYNSVVSSLKNEDNSSKESSEKSDSRLLDLEDIMKRLVIPSKKIH